jgi:ribosomal protein S18 acetylase RimI-like enzyme
MNVVLPFYKIQPTDMKDLRSLLELEQVCFSKSEMWTLLDYIGLLSLPDIIKLKAIKDDLMIGFVALEDKKRSSMAQVMTLAIHPDFRQQGIATQLLLQAESLIQFANSIELVARIDNFAAIKLYEKYGYVKDNILTNYYRDGVTGQRMVKKIEK